MVHMKEIMERNASGMKFVAKGDMKSGNRVYLCECPRCGNIVEMYASHYYRGSMSCHCLDTKSSRLYSIWINMKTRCYNENSPIYQNYGARGISICDEWKQDFRTFESWAISHSYQDNLSIDRIDNDGNYEPSNCRWVTSDVQSNNKRNNVSITIDGVTKNFKEWCKHYNLNYKTEHDYYSRHGMDVWIEKIKKEIQRLKE